MGKADTFIDQEQYSASYLDARPDSGQRHRPVSLAEILSQPNQYVQAKNIVTLCLLLLTVYHCFQGDFK